MSLQEQVPGIGTSAGPAWTIYGSKTLLAWKGEGTDSGIYWATTSGYDPDSKSHQYSWGPQQVIPNVGTSTSPALANFKGAVYLAWKGEGADQTIYWSKLDASGGWTAQQAVPGVGGTSESPALAATADTLFLAWKEEQGGARIFWSKCTDGASWSPQESVPVVGGTNNGPAMAAGVFGGVCLAWREAGGERIFWSKYTNGTTWSPQAVVPGAATNNPPVLAFDGGGNLNLAWSADNGNIFFTMLRNPASGNTTWAAQTVRYGVGTDSRPALLGITPVDYKPGVGPGVAPLMLAWKGAGNGTGIWYGPLHLPPQSYDLLLPYFQVLNMRSGSILGKTESDTDYVSLGLRTIAGPPYSTGGQEAEVITQFVGNQTGGTVGVSLNFSNVTVQDSDVVILTYLIVNSSQGDSTVHSRSN